MDDDIRDLIADDLFDPFEDDEGDTRNTAGGNVFASAALDGAEGEGGIVGEPLPPNDDETKKPLLSPEERIARLLEEMPGQKRLLLRLVDYCREAKSGEDMDAFTFGLKENCYSVYSPVVLRELLEEAGAIEYLPADGEREEMPCAGGTSPVEGVSHAEEAIRSEDVLDAQETLAADGDALGVTAAPFVDGGVLIPIDESKVRHESLVENGEEMTLSFLEIEETKPGLWVATEAGCAAVDGIDDVSATRELLEKEPRYLDIYHQILDFCAQEEYGRSSKEIDNLVNDSPLLQEPRRYSGYFVSRLERQGALEWRSGWCVTDAGREIIEEAAAKVQEDCHA